MGFWSNLSNALGYPTHEGITPNGNPSSSVGPDYNPGDPDGLSLPEPEPGERYALPFPQVSPWSGWPSEWSTPNWSQTDLAPLIDTAWDCIDLNTSVLSGMPVYLTKAGRVVEPRSWLTNPDPMVYSSWSEFAKQLFWDYQLGESFVMAMSRGADGWPLTFRVIPPWMLNVEMGPYGRTYNIGSLDVTDDILHIRYKSSVDQPRGVGPLAAAGARLTTAGVLQRQMDEVARNGGVPPYILEVQRRLTKPEADETLTMWMDSRSKAGAGAPALATGGTQAKAMQVPSPKDMALLELSQFTESRIAVKLGVPPFLVGLPSGGDSMTYSNVSSLFDFHDRASLRPKANAVMSALSGWALPRGTSVELNRDEYSRPAFNERAEAWVKLKEAGIVSVPEIRTMERLQGDAPRLPDPEANVMAADALTGGGDA